MGRRSRRRGLPPDPVIAAPVDPTPSAPYRPKLAIGAPVAERAWILPRWFDAIEQQTVQPDYFCFTYTPGSDKTLDIVMDRGGAPDRLYVRQSKHGYYTRADRNADRTDPHRAAHMAALRNELRYLFLKTDAALFLSLDTDILLEDPGVIERLVKVLLTSRGPTGLPWDVVAPSTCLHAAGERSDCYNAAFWRAGDTGSPTRIWERASAYDATRSSPVPIDIPMAVYLARRSVLGMCAYKAHECGEDMGFADSLDQHKFRCAWLPDLRVRHVWGESYL